MPSAGSVVILSARAYDGYTVKELTVFPLAPAPWDALYSSPERSVNQGVSPGPLARQGLPSSRDRSIPHYGKLPPPSPLVLYAVDLATTVAMHRDEQFSYEQVF